MRLYLVQHGEAESPERDPDRALTTRGREDIERLAALCVRRNLRVARIVHSGKTRALQTAACLAHAMLDEGEMETSGLLEPQADPAPFARVLNAWTTDTLVVGHQPFLARLAARLLGDGARPRLNFSPGSMACLEQGDDGDWTLAGFLRPELLD